MNEFFEIVRPVFMVKAEPPYYAVESISFLTSGCETFEEKQRNVEILHNEILKRHNEIKILEISTKSLQKDGVPLSAFNLKKYVKSMDKSVTVENIYQASKCFETGGPYTDLLNKTPKEAKKDTRLKTSGRIIKYVYEGKDYPAEPFDLFYDHIYFEALRENSILSKCLINYDAFTDIEFVPGESFNCQAASAAKYVGMFKSANE